MERKRGRGKEGEREVVVGGGGLCMLISLERKRGRGKEGEREGERGREGKGEGD